ncbi:hypothetical protein G7046_g8187 [Stylonectria norvegica]|nr:hypothetical protein G7046_g8187 [Stylonectria norvegica]
MSGILSKRQQARNEKVLQELVQKIPGNDMCADCHARNPAWASWSLGVFLCMRCASIHRKLGTHISKVKSLSMDTWSNEQVDNMRKVGNVSSNNIYNPEHRRPPVPVDADEADSAMERFIRQKYMNNVASVPNSSGKPKKPRFDDETPPPLPPKNSTKFGFRSASSIFPLSSKSKKEAKMAVAAEAMRSPSPRSASKSSKVFGVTLDAEYSDDTEQKLMRLREMGFQDKKRNALVLKGVSGNLERAIEALVRLGEGSGRASPLPTPSPREHTLRTSRSLTPLTPGIGGLGLGSGLSVPSRSATDRPNTGSSGSTNPFDMMPAAQPQTAQSTGTLRNNNPYNQTNPFGAPTQQKSREPDAFSQAFDNMTISPPQPQPLFPHHTGGVGSQSAQQQAMYQQPPPPMPSAPTSPNPNNFGSMGFSNSMTFPQSLQQQPTSYSPFYSNPSSPLKQQPLQQAPQHAMSVNTAQAQSAYNPFARSPTRIASPSLGQIPEQSQTSFQSPSFFQNSSVFQNSPISQSPAPLQQETSTNPFFSTTTQPVAQSQNPYSQQQTSQPQVSQNPYGQRQLSQPPISSNPYGQQIQQPQQPLYQQQQQQASQNPWGQQQPQQQQASQPQAVQQFGQQLFGQQQAGQQQPGQQQMGHQQLGQQYFGQQQTQPYGQQQFGQQQQQQPPPQPQQQQQQYYQPQRPDNASIMALYSSYSQPSTTSHNMTPSEPMQKPIQPQTIHEDQALQMPVAPIRQPRSASQPLSTGTNPFMSNASSANGSSDPFAARSRESMNLGKDLAWTNGRHSPDAFASLSARHV